jgi:Zn-dependent protease/CBS domain-containing protein
MASAAGISFGSVRGVPVRAHWSAVVIAGLVTWSLGSVVLPELAPGYGRALYWALAAATAVLVVASLLAHELGHALVALRAGIGVRDITLWMLGGVSRIEGDAATPADDFRIAVAGPATSLAVAVMGVITASVVRVVGGPELIVGCAVALASINLVLAVFNLIPAAPLDGGRILRAALWWRRGDRVASAVSATRAGRVFAYVLVGGGFAEILVGAVVSGFWMILLGWFVLNASRAEEEQIRMTRDLAGVRVRDLMTPAPITVRDTLAVEDVLHDYVLGRHCSAFPVVDAQGVIEGLVTLRHLRGVHPSERASTPVGRIALPVDQVPRAAPDEMILDVLRRAADLEEARLLVFEHGHLVGIVSPTDVARAVQLAELVHAR